MTERKKPTLDMGQIPHDQVHHLRKKHKIRPCGNPPAVPANVHFLAYAREAKTHLEFSGRLKWDEVTQDTQGHHVKIQRYDIQVVPCNASGVPIDTDTGSEARHYAHIKQPVQHVGLKAATITSGTTARFTTRHDHGFQVGGKVKVSGVTPAGYNGTWTISAKTADTFDANIGTSPADGTDFGEVKDGDDWMHYIIHHFPRPKTWYWKARVRSVDDAECEGNWCDWTYFNGSGSPLTPWAGADPKPPAPTFTDPGAVTFDRVNRGHHTKLRAKFTFNEVTNFDYPGTPADDESDVTHYVVQMDRSDDGVNWDGPPRAAVRVVSAKDEDADTTRTVTFGNIRRHWWYRFRVRTIDRFNRKSDWSTNGPGNWSTPAFPFDDTQPPRPENVQLYDKGTDRVVVEWDEPTINVPLRGTVSGTSGTDTLTGTNTKFQYEVGHGTQVKLVGSATIYTVKKVSSQTSMTVTPNLTTSPSGVELREIAEDPDVAYYDVQIGKAADINTATTPDDWNGVYKRDRARGSRKGFKVADADSGGTFAARVRSVDAARNKSDWIPAWVTTLHSGNANNYPGQTGDAAVKDGDFVTIGKGGGAAVVATFTKIGRLRVKNYANRRWTNPTGQTLTFKKARMTVGNKDASSGAPTGSAVKVNLRVWNASESASNPVWASDDTLRIEANTYKDVNGPNTFDLISSLAADEALSINVKQVGSSFPGEDLTVQIFMEP